jgi:hypothetical protein
MFMYEQIRQKRLRKVRKQETVSPSHVKSDRLLVPSVIDLAANLRIDVCATTEILRDGETNCRKKYVVTLSETERERLNTLTNRGKHPARQLTRAASC